MFNRYKNDLKTIAEILVWLAAYFTFSLFFQYLWFSIFWFTLAIARFSYSYYYKKTNKTDIVTFPTQNDDASKMAFITFSIIILMLSVICYFALNLSIYFSVAGLAIGTIVFLLGYFKSPLGWIIIENNLLRAYGIQGEIDTRQLKEVVLKNDKITLTNVYGENKSSNTLNLSPISAQNIVNFIGKKVKPEITIVNEVN